MSTSAAGGSVLALHEVLMAELGTPDPLDEEELRYFDKYTKHAAAAADSRRKMREAVLASKTATPEDKEAICELARHAETRCLNAVYAMLHHRRRSALCLSGGGIRSATFALGVLQGLAQHSFSHHEHEEKPRLLAEFDFLSTVSGGGYIGSWFSSWVQREGVAPVLRRLAYRTADKLDPEAKPVRHLREYTNYLDPKIGLFSADTWTLAATIVRNILLNWFVLLPFLAAVLLLPVIFNVVLQSPPPPYASWIVWLGFAFGVTGTGSLLHSLPSFGDWRTGQKPFELYCLLPLLLAAICISCWWCWLPEAQAKLLPRMHFIVFGTAMHFGGFLLGVALSRNSENFKPANVKLSNLLAASIGTIATGALGSLIASYAARHIHPQFAGQTEFFACFAVPIVSAILMLTGVFAVGFSSNITNDDDREWWSRAGGWVLGLTVGWLVYFPVVLLFPLLVHDFLARFPGSLTVVSAALGWYVTQAGSKSDSRPSENDSQATPPPGLLDRINGLLLPAASVLFLIALCFLLTFVNETVVAVLHKYGVPWANVVLLAVEGLFASLASHRVNVNKFSLHAMYRMRLIRAYLGASNAQRKPNPFTGFDQNDNMPVAQLSQERPLHILNMCLNLVGGSNLAWQQRKAESFTVSRLHSGSFRVGYQPSATYGHGSVPGGISLGTAMAISGAAASPNMGYHSSPLTALIMTLFNARLGWWLANPGEPGRDSWNHDGPQFGITPFLDEALGETNDQNRYIYLSDGGHFENLGVYEMVLRRVKHIVVIDAGADENYVKEDLGNAVRKVRIDLGISIEFPDDIHISPKLGLAGKRCALGKIRYDLIDNGAEAGEILYIKPVRMGNEPEDVKNYACTSPKFPHEPTSDQWFSESQFESYRRLGLFTIEEIVGDAKLALGVTELFHKAKHYLSPAHVPAATAAIGSSV